MIALERSLPLPVAVAVVAVVFAVWGLTPMIRRRLQWRQIRVGTDQAAHRDRPHLAGRGARRPPSKTGVTARPHTTPYPLPDPYRRNHK